MCLAHRNLVSSSLMICRKLTPLVPVSLWQFLFCRVSHLHFSDCFHNIFTISLRASNYILKVTIQLADTIRIFCYNAHRNRAVVHTRYSLRLQFYHVFRHVHLLDGILCGHSKWIEWFRCDNSTKCGAQCGSLAAKRPFKDEIYVFWAYPVPCSCKTVMYFS